MLNRNLIVTLLFALPTTVIHAQDADTATQTGEAPHNSLLWDVSSSDGRQDNYVSLDLALGKRLFANAGLSQSSDGTRGIYAGIVRNSEKGWLGLNYKNISVSQDYTTQTFTLNSGLVAGNWDLSLAPGYIRTTVYGQKGGSKSSAVDAFGISVGATHHGKDMDIGASIGSHYYTNRLDSYVSDSRMIKTDTLQSQLIATGLEKSYWNLYMRRYQEWGNWGLEYQDSVSAVDLSHGQSIAARAVYYLGKRWDLRLALIEDVYPDATYHTVGVGAKYYW
jgi:hypothetical protein